MSKYLIYLFCWCLWGSVFASQNDPKWIVYYAKEAPYTEFLLYDLVVFDSQEHPLLGGLKENNITTLGYINLGEVENFRFYFDSLRAAGILIGENENWPDSYYIDMRSPLWVQMVIEELIPNILFQGFDGIFMDTLDNAEYLEMKDPKKYRGMTKAAIDLVKAIRYHYPYIKIMMNRGFHLLPALSDSVDMICAESIYTTYDFKKQKYEFVPTKIWEEITSFLRKIKTEHPHLQLYSLDYWDPKDTKTIKKIYEEERKAGFIPYVSTLQLNTIIPEPQ